MTSRSFPTFSEREYRDALGRFCTGVAIITGMDAGVPAGFCVQSFLSVSLNPSLVAMCPAKSSSSWPRIRRSGHFGINILAEDHCHLVDIFAKSGGEKFLNVNWRPAEGGSPIINDAMGFIECSIEDEHDAGDHTIVVGKVLHFLLSDKEIGPLLFFRGLLYTTNSTTLRDPAKQGR